MASLKPFIRDLNGKILRAEDLPKQNTDCWGRRQKATLLLAIRGARVVYLGPGTPTAELVAAAREADVRAVVLSISAAVQKSRATRAVTAVRAALPRRVHLWLGGAGAPETVKGCVRFESLEDLDRELAARG